MPTPPRPPCAGALLAAAALASLAAAGAEPPPLLPLSVPDPLRLASLSPGVADVQHLAQGRWQVTVETAYFNVWSKSWHAAAIHREFHLEGKPLEPWELRELERRHAGDAIFQFDLEGWLGELTVARGLGRGVTLAATLPWLDVGHPHWDAVPWKVHQAMGWKMANRDVFARSATVAYAWSPRRQVALEGWGDLEGAHLADLRLALSGPLGSLLGGRHYWVAAADAPTGRRGTFAGSGGVDTGLRWFVQWRGSRAALQVGAGYTRLAPSGELLQTRRENTWHLLATTAWRAGRRTSLQVGARLDSSPLAAFTAGAPADPALTVTLAWRRELPGGGWVALALGENVPSTGVAPDFALHLQAGW